MKLTVLGCSGTFPGPESGCTSYLVEHDGFSLMLDAGNGAVGALQRHLGVFDLDAVHLSHLHADHCVDMVAYAYARHYNPAGPPPKLPVYAPDGFEARMEAMVGHAGMEDVYDVTHVEAGKRTIGPFEVELALMNHPVPCHAIRLTVDGRSFVFSGDTGESEALVDLARDADLLLIEASTLDEMPLPDVHLSARQAATHAKRAGAGRVLLTHITPWTTPEQAMEQAHGVYDGPMEVVRAGATYEV